MARYRTDSLYRESIRTFRKSNTKSAADYWKKRMLDGREANKAYLELIENIKKEGAHVRKAIQYQCFENFKKGSEHNNFPLARIEIPSNPGRVYNQIVTLDCLREWNLTPKLIADSNCVSLDNEGKIKKYPHYLGPGIISDCIDYENLFRKFLDMNFPGGAFPNLIHLGGEREPGWKLELVIGNERMRDPIETSRRRLSFLYGPKDRLKQLMGLERNFVRLV